MIFAFVQNVYVCVKRKEQNTDCNCDGALHYAVTMFPFIRCIEVCMYMCKFCMYREKCARYIDVTLEQQWIEKNMTTTKTQCFITSSIQMILIDIVDLSIESFYLSFFSSYTVLSSSPNLPFFSLLLCNGRQCHFTRSRTVQRHDEIVCKCSRRNCNIQEIYHHIHEYSTLDNK